jgi:pSer/pThr/pTyr-binding forkhead associated (FHA) protein
MSERYSPAPWDLPDEPDLIERPFAQVAQEYAATSADPPPDQGRTIMDGMATVMEQIRRPAVPVLRLVTGSSVSETSMSGARTGRGPVELELPDVPTVSREHARFTFSAGRWWVTNQGMNGLFVNGVPVSGKQPLSDGDSIRWGTLPDAPLSRIEIG